MKTCLAICVASVTFTFATVVQGSPPPYDERFQALKWHAAADRDYMYRLYIPEGAVLSNGVSPSAAAATRPPAVSPNMKWPLLIWLHGYGEKGENGRQSLKWLPMVFTVTADSPPFFILVTQHKSDEDWFSEHKSGSDFLETTYQIAEAILKEHPIDPDRVYVSGVSSGGTACWELVARHPERFAAAVPMASDGLDVSKAERLKTVPIWAFHCEVDTLTSPKKVRATVQAIQNAGGMAYLTETPNTANWVHDCWTPAITEYDAIAWMLAQHREATFVYWRPGWMSPTLMLQLACGWMLALIVIAVAWRMERRRRLRLKHDALVFERTGKTIDELFATSPFAQTPTET